MNAIPAIVMIALIPFVKEDYPLALFYIAIIAFAFFIKREKNETLIFIVGLVVMTASEYLFISTGVETFTRHSLFGIMPLWLPFLWAYVFVTIKRAVLILS